MFLILLSSIHQGIQDLTLTLIAYLRTGLMELMKTDNSHNTWLLEQLKDTDFAANFLNAASEDEDPATYLLALRKIVDARGGIAIVSEKTALSRETLYRTLSKRGNPTIKTLSTILKATGLKIAVAAS